MKKLFMVTVIVVAVFSVLSFESSFAGDLVYSTYLGGGGNDYGYGIAVDSSGNAYINGITVSSDFPTTTGAFDTSYNGTRDVFVTKLNASGTALVYSTYLGGGNDDYACISGLAIDSSGNAYITGYTNSTDFPTTSGAFDTSFNGGSADVFVSKLNASGTALVYSTYLGGSLGGSGDDRGFCLALDGSGNAYITGYTNSTDFPTTSGALDTSFNGGSADVFVSKVDSTGTALVYSTYLGGGYDDYGRGIAVDSSGNAYITGYTSSSTDFPTTSGAFDTSYNGGTQDGFVTKLNASGTALVYSTYLGGGSADDGRGIAIDSSGNAYITGYAGSSDFPTTPGAFDTSFNGGPLDGFVTKLNASGTALVYSTYLGGGSDDGGHGIAIDSSGNAYITGFTLSSDFPTTPGALDTSYNGGTIYDGFVTKLNASGTALVYSTYLGGGNDDYGQDIAIDGSGNAYITGITYSSDFPTTPGALDTSYNGAWDGFVSKLSLVPTTLVYSTYLGGGNDDLGYGIAIDSSGNAYITGWTSSPTFPTTPGAFDTSFNGTRDVFVTKLNASGNALVYSTYLGGGGSYDYGWDIAIDGSGNAYITGLTQSNTFPTTPGAFDTSYNGGTNDGFVTKLNASGSALVYSTYLGDGGDDAGNGIAVDSSGNAYITGNAGSGFPTTPGAFDTSYNGGTQDVFVTKLNASGTALVYSTYLGGGSADDGRGIAVDSSGNAYITGLAGSDFPTTPGAFDTSFNGGTRDGFVTKLNASGTALVYSTYLGGGGDDGGSGIAVDGSGNAYITGGAGSDFPTTPGAFDTSYNGNDVFVSKLNPNGTALVYSTYLGGGGNDAGNGIAVDSSGNAYVTGFTSGGFPTTPGALDTSYNGGSYDVYVTKLNASGTALLYSTYLGGGSDDRCYDIALDGSWNAYITGLTQSNNFPTTSGALDTSYNGAYDAIVSKFMLNQPPNTVTLLQPGNSVPIHTNILTFSWSTATDPDGDTPIQYQLQVDNDSIFSSPEFETGFGSATSGTPGTALPPDIYYWRVISQDPFFAQNTSMTYWCIAYDSTQSRNHSSGSPSLIYYLGTLGASTDYTPVTAYVSVPGTDTTTFTITVYDGKPPNAQPNNGQYFLSRYWTMSTAGVFNYVNMTFTYTDADFADANFGTLPESEIQFAKHLGGSSWSWDSASTRNTPANWVQSNNVSSWSSYWGLSGPSGVPAELSRFETEYSLYPPKE